MKAWLLFIFWVRSSCLCKGALSYSMLPSVLSRACDKLMQFSHPRPGSPQHAWQCCGSYRQWLLRCAQAAEGVAALAHV